MEAVFLILLEFSLSLRKVSALVKRSLLILLQDNFYPSVQQRTLSTKSKGRE